MKKEWIKEAYETAREHGFHDVMYSDEHFLMLVLCEVAEAVEADRRGSISEDDNFKVHTMTFGEKGKTFSMTYRRYIKGSVSEELADICIRLFDLAGLKGLDVVPMDEDVQEWDKLLSNHFAESSFTERGKYLCDMYLCSTQRIGLEQKIRGALIYLTLWAKNEKIDLDFHIEMKMRYNKTRSNKHGKDY